jgi:hypothetical protein
MDNLIILALLTPTIVLVCFVAARPAGAFIQRLFGSVAAARQDRNLHDG